MKKSILILISLISIWNSHSQKLKNINGIFNDKTEKNDSIYLLTNLNEKYFEKSKIVVNIKNNKFQLKNDFSYPQMYRTVLNREFGIKNWRDGFYFIDNTTNKIIVDSVSKSRFVNGLTGLEFKNKFIPFFEQKNPSEKINGLFWNQSNIAKDNYNEYINQNPNSYVALWFLIVQINRYGFTSEYIKTLSLFSNKIKAEKLWKIINQEYLDLKIIPNKKFPEFALQNVELKPEILNIPKAKYTIIDFWFSRCKPCLEEMPQLISIYHKFKQKGFNVIGISVDQTPNLEIWQKRIGIYKIPWKNYLDENAVLAHNEKIFSSPTHFLLNENGEVIQKNIELDELEKLLTQELKD